ncbi:CmpA/NrtA family ABC transporter substrate-binding protein [Phaeobacter sp. 22II1-1F12B]|uniref:CmpA/NrtA family ABC transporter substrate-binding protein n=1 Tax=Phaeobacter sp. 22II1-1F12B TaxID=1317111 RepID=UPI000B526082|nr:CmpA/NrtA family ABC transporter substrate-binding protein [Phaeobacter sp. 22II1-1F12B]OWU80634.1 nitrate transporter [Phaeobacter sp. 22II1-1F12B]
MSKRHLNCGYVPLVDSAPLIIARELKFASDEGLDLNLLRQPSWAALRDLLALGHLDAAHMLSPMPIAMTLGLSGVTCRIDAPMVLSVNGDVFGVSSELAGRMRANGWSGAFHDPLGTAAHLMSAATGPLRVGVPFPFSMHRLLFEYWFAGIDTGVPEFEIITTPPPLMADKVGQGELDMFVVGEPWGSVAVDRAAGELILPGRAIWAVSPEKVLGLRHDWVEEHPDVTGRLMRAIYRAADWLDTPDNQPLACEILSRSEHLDLPDEAIDRALSGNIVTRPGAPAQSVPGFLKFQRGAATFPWRSQAAWISAQIARIHGIDPQDTIAKGQSVFRPDLYRQHLGGAGVDLPGASAKVEGAMRNRTAVASRHGHMILAADAFFDGQIFDF